MTALVPEPLPAMPIDDDTVVIYYDDGTHRTWWCSDRDSFGVAVRFTPAEHPCLVTGARAEVGYDEGQQVYLRVYDASGPDGKPGAVLHEEQRLDIPPGQNQGFRDYDLATGVSIADGDFYICFWQKHWFHLLFGSDQQMDSLARQWWFFPDLGWVPPSGMDAADHLIRAKVVYPTGMAGELGGQTGRLRLEPNPAAQHLAVMADGVVELYSVAGCRAAVLRPGPNDVGSLAAGVYLGRERGSGRTAKVTIRH
jgi:hypothetical protein